MHLRRTALALALTAGLLAPVVATPAMASAPAVARAAKSVKPVKPAKPAKPAKPVKPAKRVKVVFSASGLLTTVDAEAGTVTVAAKGGTKDVRGRAVTVVLAPGARIVLDDAPAVVSDLQAGFRVTVTGIRTGTVYTATKVRASAPDDTPETEPTEPAEPAEPVTETAGR